MGNSPKSQKMLPPPLEKKVSFRSLLDDRWIKHDNATQNPEHLHLHNLFWKLPTNRFIGEKWSSDTLTTRAYNLRRVKRISSDAYELAKLLYRDKMAYVVLITPEQYRNNGAACEYVTNTIPLDELVDYPHGSTCFIHRAPLTYTLIDEVFARDLQNFQKQIQEHEKNMLASWTLSKTEQNSSDQDTSNPVSSHKTDIEDMTTSHTVSPSAPEIEEGSEQEGEKIL
jgi:hypothetical protein